MRYIGATTTVSLLMLLTRNCSAASASLLTSIQESAGVVQVREAILAEKERAFGVKSKEAGRRCLILGTRTGASATTPSNVNSP